MDNSSRKPYLMEGGIAVDDRGQVSFVNDFDFKNIKRFYVVENFSLQLVRAFHGHLKEEKYVFVTSGSIVIVAVYMDDPLKPDRNNELHRFVLSSRKPSILYIPAGYTHGFKCLEENTKIMFLSTSSLEESKSDDYRLPYDYWGGDIWNVEHR